MKFNLHRFLAKMWHWRLIQFFIPSRLYCCLEFKRRTGKRLNLRNPKTFNEKLQWLKLFDHNPIYSKLVDKHEVRKYVEERIGDQYLIPLIGVYESIEKIPFGELPKEYVLKCTHDSGTVIIKNVSCTISENQIGKTLEKAMRRNYYYAHREWPYKKVKPRIICEQYMVDESNVELKDYKIHCFDGEPKLIQVDFGRFSNHRRNLYDTQWNYLSDSTILYPNDSTTIIEKPINLGELLELSTKLAKPFPYVRVDFYVVKSRIYFGELTFYHGAGYELFSPYELEVQMGDWLQLPRNKVK